MEWPPLIPKRQHTECPEVSHVVREVFQEQLSHCLLPSGVDDDEDKLRNRRSSMPSTKYILRCKQELICKSDIVETDIMGIDADHLIKSDFLAKDLVLTESLRMKHLRVYQEMQEDHFRKFHCLLRKKDILPIKAELAVDFRFNPGCHSCRPPCPSVVKITDTSPLTPVKLPKRQLSRKSQAENVFTADPKVITFCDYELNKLYHKSFKLRNVGRETHSFATPIPPKCPRFTTYLVSESNRVAPGMCAYFRVTYKTTCYKDTEDKITIKADTGSVVEVVVRSYRTPPILSIYNFKHTGASLVHQNVDETMQAFDSKRASALNFTFDCGSCLVGDRVVVHLIIKNEGGPGEFFLMTEQDWFLSTVSTVCRHTELCAEEFEIYPCYFGIEENDVVDLCLTFVPLYYGLHTERIFMLCNNNMYEELELVGDGIVFEKDFVKIDVPPKQERMSFMDFQSEYYMYLGNCLSYSRHTAIITVRNTSCLYISYRWEMRNSVSFESKTILKQMETYWVSIRQEDKNGILPPDSTTDFHFTITPNTTVKGLYSMVLSFYVECIPEASLAENKNFCVVNPSDQNDGVHQPLYWDVLIGEVEIACVISPPDIHFDPPQMILPITLKYKEQVKKTIRLQTSNFKLQCKWKIFNKRNGQKCCVRIHPANFYLKPRQDFECELTICAHTYNDVSEKMVLFANESLFRREYLIKVEVTKPRLQFSTNRLNFGFVPKGRMLQKSFKIENFSQERVEWQVIEFTYDFLDKSIREVTDSHITIRQGVFDEYAQTTEVFYTIDTEENHRWFSFLMLVTCHPNKVATDSLMLITYEVCQPSIRIHSFTSVNPILCPSELLYVGVTQYYPLCIHNDGNLCGYFIWGETVGDHAKAVKVNVQPRSGVIQPGEIIQVAAEMTPVYVGLLEHIYLPCFVGRLEEPIVIKVMCAVDTFHVNFLLPNDRGQYTSVRWPRDTSNDVDFEVEEYVCPENVECSELYLTDLYPDQIQFTTAEEEVPEEEHADVAERPLSCPCPSSISCIKSVSSDDKAVTELFLHKPASGLSLIQTYFKGDLTLFEHVVQVHDVPINTPIKRTFIIENLTPMHLCFNVENSNFECALITSSFIEDLLEKMNFKKSNKWEKLLPTGKGMIVRPNPTNGEIDDYDSAQVDLWMYADTWGIYVEEIAVEINNSTPFCFNLLVRVIGLPLEFPIALNSIQNVVKLRLGTMNFKSPCQHRQVRVKNVTSVTVMMSWHIFLKDEGEENNSFNLICDLDDEFSSENSFVINEKVFLSEECYGKEVFQDIFQIEPQRLIIEPHASNTLHITFKPKYFKSELEKKEIVGSLVGYTYLTEDTRYQPNLFYRPTGIETDSIKMQISATIEMALFQLHTALDNEELVAYANDIIASKSKWYRFKLTFTKSSSAIARLSVSVDSPFVIENVRTGGTDYNPKEMITVGPNQCLEVDIKCEMTGKYVLELSPMLYQHLLVTEILNEEYSSVVLKRYVHMEQSGVVRQSFPFEFTLYYPEIHITEENVNFGIIHIGNSKKYAVIMTNSTGAPVPFKVNLEHNMSNFIVKPTAGELPRATGTSKSSVVLYIYFVPTQVGKYQGTIQIETNIPVYFKTISLTGTGSQNERYCSDIL